MLKLTEAEKQNRHCKGCDDDDRACLEIIECDKMIESK